MTNAPSETVRATLDDPFAQLTGSLAGTRRLQLEVTGAAQLTPHMRRLELTAPELDGFGFPFFVRLRDVRLVGIPLG